MLRSLRSSEKSELTQFAHLWVEINNDYKISKTFLIEYLKEQTSHWYDFRKQWKFQHFIDSRTPLVDYLPNSEFYV